MTAKDVTDSTLVDMYLDFTVHRCSRSGCTTDRFRIVSLTENIIGMVDYYPVTRKWALRPAVGSVWFGSMLEGVADFIRKLEEGTYKKGGGS